MKELREACQVANPAEQERCLRQAALLFGSPVVDAKIAVSAYESAALEILGDGVPFMVSYDAEGRALATIVMVSANGQDNLEMTAEAQTPALALLAAYTGALCERQALRNDRLSSRQGVGTRELH